jgi:hypothetical protein
LTVDSSLLPVERPEIGTKEHVSRDFCWESLVASTVHPVKVAIVEALLWVHEPLSATEFAESFGVGDHNLDIVGYHLRDLARLEVVEVTATRRVRGAREKYFFFRSNIDHRDT